MTKAYTVILQIFQHAFAWEVLSAVKGHVLQEMRQTELLGSLKSGAYFLGNVEVCTSFRLLITHYVVIQPVRKGSMEYFLIQGQRCQLRLLGPYGEYAAYEHHQTD